MKKAVMCIVGTSDKAELVVDQLHRAGFTSNDISVLFPDRTGTRDFAHEHSTKAPEGAIGGASMGGVVGGTLGLLAGMGALAIPGLGPFIAAGPIMAALSGVGVGATVGGLAGALVGMGIPEIEAKRYEGKIKGGNMLVSVHTESGEERTRAENIFTAAQADDVCSVAEASVPQAAPSHPAH
jgi:hypothetical protein